MAKPRAPRPKRAHPDIIRGAAPRIVDARQADLFHDPMSDRVEPCLATLVPKIPAGPEWAYEIKWDGYRLAIHIAYGKPFASGASFGNWFKDRCIEAQLPDCSPHGLRKGGATLCSENGGSEVELEAMYGWSNTRQSGTYTKKARALLLATKGFERIAETLVLEGILKSMTEQRSDISVAP